MYTIVTLRALENWFYEHDEQSMFDNIVLPEYIDKEDLIVHIFDRAGDFGVLHVDPDYAKMMTETFFRTHLDQFQRMVDAITAEYNPIENYDRHEKRDNNSKGDSSFENDGHSQMSGSDTTTTNYGKITTGTRAAFNSNSYEPYDKSTESGSDTVTNSPATKNTTHAEGEGDHKEEFHETAYIHGNIGVTTNAEMVTQELKLRLFNIYELIANMYVKTFCIMVY